MGVSEQLDFDNVESDSTDDSLSRSIMLRNVANSASSNSSELDGGTAVVGLRGVPVAG